MSLKVVYQTLEDRNGDLDYLEEHGPYLCDWKNSWLGDGYYFWDTFIENAHWWGKIGRSYPNYIICEGVCDFNDTECFDLHGNLEHLNMLKEAYKLMETKNLVNSETTVKKVISFLRGQLRSFNFTAIRANGMLSRNLKSEYNNNLKFELNKPHYLELQPTVQICFTERDSMNLRDYKIVYPDKYRFDNRYE